MKKVADLFGLDDENWMRHSNKWSVWTRFIILPLLAMAIWSRLWLGWYCLVPVFVILFWTWINPRFFNRPTTTKHWASKAVFGERVWLKKIPAEVADHHMRAARVLSIITGSGLPFITYGLWRYDFWATSLGVTIVVMGKMWFLDRMVWIFEEAKVRNPEYESWEY